MPYITKDYRKGIDSKKFPPVNGGELNYVITKIIIEYLKQNGTKYWVYNDILGALEGAKLELYRRKIAPYEDKKIKENGDVY